MGRGGDWALQQNLLRAGLQRAKNHGMQKQTKGGAPSVNGEKWGRIYEGT